MAKNDANPPMPAFTGDYVLQEVGTDYLAKSVKPKQFLHIDQSECIMCEGCVDICPWKCIHMLSTDTIAEAVDTEQPGTDPDDKIVFCVDRCPTGVIIMGKAGVAAREGDPHGRDEKHGYAYGMRF